MKTAAADPDEIRRAFMNRLREEALTDYRLSRLKTWLERLPSERAPDAVELLTIALDAPRKGRWIVLWLVDNRLRAEDDVLPHAMRLAFLRWAVRSRSTQSKVVAKLNELRAAPTPTALNALVDALTGDQASTSSLANAHSILAHAWQAAPPDARPTGLVHRGEPEPFIGARGTVRLAAFVARRVCHLAPKADKKLFTKLVDLAEQAADKGKPSAKLDGALESAAREGVIGIARAACAEAKVTLLRPDSAGSSARPAAVKAVGHLLATDGKNAVRDFLAALDEELRRLDVVHALVLKKKEPKHPIAHAVFRGADAKGKIVVWLARLANGQLGLLSKQGTFWRWMEGPHDEILATIPDHFFERAVMAAKA
jgi:hypothetical protein